MRASNINKMTVVTNEINLTNNNLPEGGFQVKP